MQDERVARLHVRSLADFFLIGAAIALRFTSPLGATVSYLLLAAHATRGGIRTLHALGLSCLLAALNPGLAPEMDASSTMFRQGMVLWVALVLLLRWLGAGVSMTVSRDAMRILVVGMMLIAHAALASTNSTLSLLKTANWLCAMLVAYGTWQALDESAYVRAGRHLFVALAAVVLVSLPFLVVPDIGYLRNGTGFQGILNHPQVFGPVAALCASIAFILVLQNGRPTWRNLVVLVLSLAGVVLSESRSALVAVVAAVAVSVALSLFERRASLLRRFPGIRSGRLSIVVIGLLLVAAASWESVAESARSFLFKRSDAVTLVDAAEASRGLLVMRMIENLEQKPWLGIGFGVPSDSGTGEVVVDPVFGIPVSAPVEKGVVYLALFEELGIPLGVVVLSWVVWTLRCAARTGPPQLAAVVAVFAANLGEATLFSPGGMGLLQILVLGWAIGRSDQQKKVTVSQWRCGSGKRSFHRT